MVVVSSILTSGNFVYALAYTKTIATLFGLCGAVYTDGLGGVACSAWHRRQQTARE